MGQPEDVLSVPAGRTHKLIVEHGIHAHPDTRYYSYRPARYLAFRQRGGVMETLYGFELMCTLDPRDDEAIASLRGEFGRRLRAYVDARRRAAGFGHPGAAYKFYDLPESDRVSLPHRPRLWPNPQNQRYFTYQEMTSGRPEVNPRPGK